jgi:YD repeat-containing protein
VVSTETAGGDATTSVYDPDGNLISTTTPPTASATSGMTTTNAYDGDGRLCATLSPLGYEAAESLASCPTSSADYVTTYGYNANGNQICQASQDAAVAGDICPDEPTGRVTDTTTNTYDGNGNLIETTNPLGDSTWYFYDADGNEADVTSADGNGASCDPLTYPGNCADTTYQDYDSDNRLTETFTPPNPSNPNTWAETSYTYNADGDQHTVTDPDGNITTDTYNGADQLIGISYSGGSYSDQTPTAVSYTYNADGSRASMTDGTGTSTYSYDLQGRMDSAENGAGDTTTYGYDAASNENCVTYPGASTTCAGASAPPSSCSSSASPATDMVQYQYDTSGRMCKVTDWVGDTFAYSYDADSENTSMQASSSTANVTVTDSYDGGGRLDQTEAATGSTNLYTEAYTLDADGNELTDTPTSAITGWTSSLEESYTPVNGNDEPERYALSTGSDNIAYDNAGPVNKDANVFTSAKVAEDGQLCWSLSTGSSSNLCGSEPGSNATAYGYDPDGNLVSGTPESGSVDPSALGWNAAAELACQNTNGTSCSLSSPTSSTTTLAYDGNDNLTSWTTGTSGSQTSQALTWSATASNQLLSSYAAPADETTDYVYGLHATPLEQVTLAGSSTVTNLLLTDSNGSVDGLVRLSGSGANTLQNLTSYGPYGDPESEQSGTLSNGLQQPNNSTINSNFGSATDSTDTTLLGFGAGVVGPTGLVRDAGLWYSPASGGDAVVSPGLLESSQSAPHICESIRCRNPNPNCVLTVGAGIRKNTIATKAYASCQPNIESIEVEDLILACPPESKCPIAGGSLVGKGRSTCSNCDYDPEKISHPFEYGVLYQIFDLVFLSFSTYATAHSYEVSTKPASSGACVPPQPPSPHSPPADPEWVCGVVLYVQAPGSTD